MGAHDTALRELHRLLDASPVAPEWRWNAHRHLVLARTALVVPGQPRGVHDDLSRADPTPAVPTGVTARLEDLSEGVLDRMPAGDVVREVVALLHDLEG